MAERPPMQDLPDAEQRRQIQVDDRVGPLEAEMESARVVAVHDPVFARGELALPVHPFDGRERLPARTVVVGVEIEMDNGEAERLSQFPGQAGLAGAASADDRDPLQGRRRR